MQLESKKFQFNKGLISKKCVEKAMLGRLVNKFQQHSLSDDQSPSDNLDSVDGLNELRRNIVPNMLYPNNFNDSGTESENEEELEQLETSYLMSLATDETQLGPSPPVLTSSPPLISDFDTNSWDSTGCESGIVVREQNEEMICHDLSKDFVSHEEYSVRSENLPFYSVDTGRKEDTAAAGGNTAVNSGCLTVGSFAVKYGAFRPFRRRVKDQDNGNVPSDSTPLTIQGVIGEKRRYNNITPKPDDDKSYDYSTIFPRSTSVGSGIPRETLVACRRTPVKLIIYNPDGVRRSTSKSVVVSAKDVADIQSESPPFRPVKRGRLNTCERPSLDFEKMRERMMTNWSSCQDAESVEAENRIVRVSESKLSDEAIYSGCRIADSQGAAYNFRPHSSND